MDEETILKIADLLKMRKNQREYAEQAEKTMDSYASKVKTHRQEIRTINAKLYELGYKGQ